MIIKESLEYFKSQANTPQDLVKKLSKFVTRLELTTTTIIDIQSINVSPEEKSAHEFALRLSEAWFSFEALIPVIEEYNYVKPSKPRNQQQKEFKTISDALSQQVNYCDMEGIFGKATIFDESRITDAYLEYLLEEALKAFQAKINHIISNHEDGRLCIQKYMIYLEENSKGSQKKLLLEPYNQLTNHSEAKPDGIMAISYAVRNQYVHNGEIMNSGIENTAIKADLLNACYDFVITYSIITATQICIDNNPPSLAPVPPFTS